MCGFLGHLGDPDRLRPEDGLVALAHRGPDAGGVRDLTVGGMPLRLLHTRLRVIDPSPEADQPISNEDETVWVVFNGEIYNHPELRAELEDLGHRFRSRTDTEVLVHLHEEEPDPARLLGRLRGMFAFVLVDVRRGTVLAARDRLGIKPLWMAAGAGRLAFASEVRALVAAGVVDGGPDPTVVRAYLGAGVVPGPGSIVAGVREVPPGGFVRWAGGSLEEGRYWTPAFSADPLLCADAPRLVAAALRDAVARHLVADRPVGLFLSGGVDSGSLARFASEAGEVRSLTVVFPEEREDERAAARAWAERFGLRHEEVEVRGEEVARRVEEILRAMDQPSSDGVNTWIVSRAAREAGLVVALSGVGGDELFAGYPSFRLVPRVARAVALARLLPDPARTGLSRFASRRVPGGRLARVLGASDAAAGAYEAVRGLFAPAEVGAAPQGGSADGGAEADGWADRVALFELTRYLPRQLLRDTDQMSMAHSLEVRVPLLDDAVVNVALSLPAAVRARTGKDLLCRAAGIEPAQPKRPFTLPFDRWLRGPLAPVLREGLLSEELPFASEIPCEFRRRLLDAYERGRCHWSRPWAVAVLRLWPAANGFRW